MALRNQPYIPLYVNDFITDEKLMECSAESTGVYIRLMCLMHKSESYGEILLKQKHKQSNNQIENFANCIVKNLPYTYDVVLRSLIELIDEKVLHIEGDALIQKRMAKDNTLSELRSTAGKKGGQTTQNKTKQTDIFAKAKDKANTVIENEYEIVIENDQENQDQKNSDSEIITASDVLPAPLPASDAHTIWYEQIAMKNSKTIAELDQIHKKWSVSRQWDDGPPSSLKSARNSFERYVIACSHEDKAPASSTAPKPPSTRLVQTYH